MASAGKGNYFTKEGLLYHTEKRFGQTMEAICIPEGRRPKVLRMAHDTAHWASKKTKERIRISGMTWPTEATDVSKYAASCESCQKRARITCYDWVKIAAIPRDTEPFRHWFMDCAGPLLPGQNIQYNYALILVDSALLSLAIARWHLLLCVFF
jgi:Integrase zinc binding domain